MCLAIHIVNKSVKKNYACPKEMNNTHVGTKLLVDIITFSGFGVDFISFILEHVLANSVATIVSINYIFLYYATTRISN